MLTQFKHFLFQQKYMHFFVTGVTGVLLNMLVTWLLTKFVFGVERYFIGYIVGAGVNLLYNFSLHTIITFQTTERHMERFVRFIGFSLLSAGVQIIIVRTIVSIVGKEYYLIVIAGTIFMLSILSFLFFKHSLFN